MRITLIILVSALLISTIFLSFNEKIFAEIFATNSKSDDSGSSIPEYVLYESVFRLDLSFRRKALEQELTSQPITGFKTYFKDNAELTDVEDEALRQVAIEYLVEIQPIETQTNLIISQIREQFPDGLIQSGQEVPPPPPALLLLQEQRNAAAISNWNKLSSRLSGKSFTSLDEFVKTGFADNFRSLAGDRQ